MINKKDYIIVNLTARNILIIVISLQIVFLSLLALNYINIQFPLILQIIGFIYISFFPGFLLIKIINLDRLNLIELFSYSIGLSLSLIMILGLIINSIYPLIGINEPLSLKPLILTFSCLMIVLIFFFYITNDKKICTIKFEKFYNNKIITALIIILPLMSIIGTSLVNTNIFNFFLVLLFPLIVLLMLIFVFKTNSHELYPLVIFSISLSLLFQRSLISNYLTGFDIQSEYYYVSLVLKSSYFNINVPGTLNSMLSLTFLNPIYAKILNMNEIWVFKIIYPLIFAIVPLYLYNLYSKVIKNNNSKIAFFSVLLFVSFYAFFTEMLALARQEIAFLFVVLLSGLIILEKKSYKISLLTVLFLMSLVFSHYTTAYLYLFLLMAFTVPYLFKKNQKIGISFILLFLTIIYTWYVYTSQSEAFMSAFKFINRMFSSIQTEFFSLGSRDPGVSYLVGQIPESSLQRKFYAIFQYTIQISIAFGIIKTILKNQSLMVKKDYLKFAYGSFLLLILTIIIPFLSTINISRLFLFSLIFIAPFSIIGGISIFRILFQKFDSNFSINNALKIFVVLIIIPYFLLNTGFIYYATNDPPSSITLDNNMDYAKYKESEVAGVKWFVYNRNGNSTIIGDVYGSLIFLGYIQDISLRTISNGTILNNKTYLFFREYNIKNNKLFVSNRNKNGLLFNEYVNMTSKNFPLTNKIYDSGSSILLFEGEQTIIQF
ncbi:MAG: DUF2206 domain-containing protein [Methanobacteriaceae archaeon]